MQVYNIGQPVKTKMPLKNKKCCCDSNINEGFNVCLVFEHDVLLSGDKISHSIKRGGVGPS
jgi:hypothetical protein